MAAGSDARWGPRGLAIALIAVAGAWLGTGIAGATTEPQPAPAPQPVIAAASDGSDLGVPTRTIEEIQLGLGGGTVLLLGVGTVLLRRSR